MARYHHLGASSSQLDSPRQIDRYRTGRVADDLFEKANTQSQSLRNCIRPGLTRQMERFRIGYVAEDLADATFIGKDETPSLFHRRYPGDSPRQVDRYRTGHVADDLVENANKQSLRNCIHPPLTRRMERFRSGFVAEDPVDARSKEKNETIVSPTSYSNHRGYPGFRPPVDRFCTHPVGEDLIDTTSIERPKKETRKYPPNALRQVERHRTRPVEDLSLWMDMATPFRRRNYPAYSTRLVESLRTGPVVEDLVDATPIETDEATSLIHKKYPAVKILQVKTVKNNFLEAMYLLKKDEYQSRYGSVDELLLVHVTAESNVQSIIKENFDWRRISRGKFGLGTSFSEDAKYANRYANEIIGDDRAFIITKVLVSNTIGGRYGHLLPRGGYDTTTGNCKRVYVKYCDHEVLPVYVAYYNNGTSCTSSYLDRYLVDYSFEDEILDYADVWND